MLFRYIKNYKYLVFLSLFSPIIAAFVTLSFPKTVLKILDYDIRNIDNLKIIYYFCSLFFLSFVLSMASGIRYYSVSMLGEKIVSDLYCDIFKHSLALNRSFYDRSNSENIISKISFDIMQIKFFFNNTFAIFLRNIILSIGSIIIMILISLKLSLIVALTIFFLIIPFIKLGRKVKILSKSSEEEMTKIGSFFAEVIHEIRTIQAFNYQFNILEKYYFFMKKLLKISKKSIISRTCFITIIIFLLFSSIIFIIWIGINEVANHIITSTSLGEFIIYTILSISAFAQLSESSSIISQFINSIERIELFFSEKKELLNNNNYQKISDPLKGKILFKNVYFSYSSSLFPVIKKLNFCITPGETIAIVGFSGAGKSTIFSLLLKFYDPVKGEIYIDNFNIKQIRPYDIRKYISYVPQEIAIFNNTIRYNIEFGNNNKNFKDIKRAAIAANIYRFIISLKDGFDTYIGDRGVTISRGQKQRIAIARVFLKNSPIVLLDEITSSLDIRNEKIIQNTLKKFMKNRTTMIISHRLETILQANRILVLNKGSIVEQGTHESLIKKKSFYFDLFQNNFRLS